MRKTLAAFGSIAVALTVTLATVALADYQRDDSFGGDGLATAESDGADWYSDVETVDGGYVVAGGWNNGRIVVAKRNEDGSTDTSFTNQGRRIIEVGAYSQGLCRAATTER